MPNTCTHKKAPDNAGAFQQRSVPRRPTDATPVKAIDQLAAYRLDPFLGVFRDTDRQSGRGETQWVCFSVELRETIFGLPEQAGQKVQCVLVASTEEPTLIGA